MRKPLYPHTPKKKEPLFPHRPKVTAVIEPFNIHLRAFWEDDMENVEKLIRKLDTNTLKKLYGMTIEVTPGQFFPNPRTGEPMLGDTWYFHGKPYLILLGTKPSPRVVYHEIAHAIGIEDEELAMKFAIEQEARLKSRGVTPTAEAEIDQIIADLNLLREERVWIDTFKTKGASLIHLQSGETATIIEPPEDFTSPNYADRAMQIKWADGREMVVDSNDFAPSSLQKQIAEITHGKPIPPFPEAVARTMQRELTFNDVKHELVGSFKTKQEADNEANYWRKRRHRARVITSFVDDRPGLPYHLYISISRSR